MNLFFYLYHFVWMKLTSAAQVAIMGTQNHISLTPVIDWAMDLPWILTYDKNTL